jgi:hypothetical protein
MERQVAGVVQTHNQRAAPFSCHQAIFVAITGEPTTKASVTRVAAVVAQVPRELTPQPVLVALGALDFPTTLSTDQRTSITAAAVVVLVVQRPLLVV